jgi:hypothetical protein
VSALAESDGLDLPAGQLASNDGRPPIRLRRPFIALKSDTRCPGVSAPPMTRTRSRSTPPR